MFNFNNNLNKAFLTLIFLVSTSFYYKNGFAEQKRRFDKFPTTCQIKEYKITCDNFKINNKFRVKLYNNPNRVFLSFEKKIIVSKDVSKNSLIKNANFVFTHDTGLMHVAAAFKNHIFAIWGSTTPKFGMYPYRITFVVFENTNLKCRPCSKIGFKKCPKNHFRCMNDLTFDFNLTN